MIANDYWLEPFTLTQFRFARVSRTTGLETGTIKAVKGGTITRNIDTDIKESGSFTLTEDLDIGTDLIRVFANFTWFDGNTYEEALGTFIPAQPSRTITGAVSESTVNLYGRLQELSDDVMLPTTYEAGTNAVTAAREIAEDCGLTVISDNSSYTLSSARTYGVGSDDSIETKLAAINDLLDCADFNSATTDAYGNIVFSQYVEPSARGISWEFEEGTNAKFTTEMEEERDTTSVANHIVTLYQSDDTDIIGEAWDTAAGSEFSTVSIGRTITNVYTYSELPTGDNTTEQTATANAKAEALLKTAQSVVHRVTITHTYVPLTLNNAVLLTYPTGNISGTFYIRTQTIELVGGCPITAELRAYDRNA